MGINRITISMQHQRARARTLARLRDRLVDQVAVHRCPRGPHEVVGVVVAEHRERHDHRAGQDRLLRHGDRDPHEGTEGPGAQVAAGLEQAQVHPVDPAVDGQDHVRDVPVDERQDHRDGLPESQSTGVGDDVGEHQEAVHPSVRRQEALPREDPHQVADPERGHQQDEVEGLALPAVAGDVVGDEEPHHDADQRSRWPRTRACGSGRAARTQRRRRTGSSTCWNEDVLQYQGS